MSTDKHRPAFAAQRLAGGALDVGRAQVGAGRVRTQGLRPEACLKGRGHLRSGGVISQILKSDGGDKRAVFCKSEQVVVVQFCVLLAGFSDPQAAAEAGSGRGCPSQR